MYGATSAASLKSIAIPEEWQNGIDTTPESAQSGKLSKWCVRVQQRILSLSELVSLASGAQLPDTRIVEPAERIKRDLDRNGDGSGDRSID